MASVLVTRVAGLIVPPASPANLVGLDARRVNDRRTLVFLVFPTA